jgi:LCP family protein required for cell wall assembly
LFLVVAIVGSMGVAAGSVYGVALYHTADDAFGRLGGSSGSGSDGSTEGSSQEPTIIHDRQGLCAKGICTYLVMGNDSRKGLTGDQLISFGSLKTVPGQRSDTIMLVQTDARRDRAVVVSFPRDLDVDIPGHGEGHITSAYQDGPLRVAQVVSNLTGIEVNHFVSVNLAGFQQVVDAVGTIPICVSAPLVDYTGFSGLNLPKAGCYDLDGAQALAFVRARHICDEGGIPDFNRIARQQQFLRALLVRVLRPSMVLRAPGLIRQVASNLLIDRHLNLADIISLSDQLSGAGTGAVDFRSLPVVIQDTDGDGIADVTKMDPVAGPRLFRRLTDGKPLGDLGIVQPLTPPSPAVIKVAVADDRSGGVAARVQSLLTAGGFDVQPQIDGSLGQGGPVVLYRPGGTDERFADEAQVVAKAVPGLELREAPDGLLPAGVDVVVVVDSSVTLPGGDGGSTPAPQPSGGPPTC